MSQIALSAGVRANLLSLQNTAALMQQTQTNLATGKKVNSALDNPLNFFTSQSLNNRANTLNSLLDSMSNGIQTIQAANNGITSITSLVNQLQSIVSQARGDTTGGTVTPGAASAGADTTVTGTNNTITFNVANGVSASINADPNTTVASLTGTAVAASPIGTTTQAGSITIQSANIDGGAAISVAVAKGDTLTTIATNINSAIATADPTNGSHLQATVTGSGASSHLVLTNDTGNQVTLSDATSNANGTAAALGFTSGTSSTNGVVGTPLTVTQLASAINGNSTLQGQVSASVVSGKLVLQNLTASAITVNGINSAGTNVTGVATDQLSLAAGTGGGISAVRTSLMNTYNNLLSQITQTSSDSGFNGTNLLGGDSMTLKFNENGTSSLTVQMQDANGNSFSVNATSLGLTAATSSQFGSNSQLDSLTTAISTALSTLQTQSTAISSSLSVVQARQDFTNNMVNTLQTGANNLVLADPNQEGANLLALQTRQSLSTTALSMASQADQAVLRLFQ
jgi:flagellin-like hook-associated protein FlgL